MSVRPIEMREYLRGLIHTSREGAVDDDAHEVALIALGNMGSPKDAPVIKSYLRNRNPLLRRQALLSLRRIPGSPTTDSIMAQFVADPNNLVKQVLPLLTCSEFSNCDFLFQGWYLCPSISRCRSVDLDATPRCSPPQDH